MNKIEDLIAQTEKEIQENTNQINQLNAIRDNKIAYANKLLGRLEAYNELLNEREAHPNDVKDDHNQS